MLIPGDRVHGGDAPPARLLEVGLCRPALLLPHVHVLRAVLLLFVSAGLSGQAICESSSEVASLTSRSQGQYSSIIPSLDFANQGLSLATNIISLFNTTVAAVLCE
jgi:hypothetical protein